MNPEYISLEEIINKSIELGVNYGKSDPYNRLRYYTKMGWLPHMIRKKNKDNGWTSYYPLEALDNLILIENLKSQNYSNNQIQKVLRDKHIIYNHPFKLFKLMDKQKIWVIVLIILLLGLIASFPMMSGFGRDMSTTVEHFPVLLEE